MINERRDTSVIHLVWLPSGIEYFKLFIDTYLDHDPAYPHQLVIAFNGLAFDYGSNPEEYIEYLIINKIASYKCLYFQNGQDIEIYQKISTEINSEIVLFLNSYSQINTANWLRNYVDNMNERVGVISATASHQSYHSSVFQKNTWKWEWEKGFRFNFRKYKLFIKAFFYWRTLFKSFPNPHVRTNAFMVRRNEFIAMNPEKITSKFKAYLFESGRNSLTNYYLNKGLKVLVLDKYGKTYEPHEWIRSSTFWIDNQENLLISDNQTRLYENGSEREKKLMKKLAWGIIE